MPIPGRGRGRWPSVAAVLMLFVAGYGLRPGPALGAPKQNDEITRFLARHWHRPLAPNGPAPSNFSPLEASLAPSACGACHSRQYRDWRGSRHSHAMSPGLIGQLQAMGPGAGNAQQACLQCHAPLAEQQEQLVKSLVAGRILPPLADGASAFDGLTCAGCHVRKNHRFGPPRADGSAPADDSELPHDGWQASLAFEDSRFCAACHQFGAGGRSLAGKPLENTYAEWRASPFAREGRSCQSCHMPGRRHLWRGIHDPAMVRSGVTITTALAAAGRGRIDATLSIANTGVGHAFPTYVTPKIVVEIGQEDRQGQFIPGTVERHRIDRHVSLDLSVEYADTRLMPGASRVYAYRRRREPRAVALAFRIIVYPDAFYTRFYRAVLRDPAYRRGWRELRLALRQSLRSHYLLFNVRRRLPPPG